MRWKQLVTLVILSFFLSACGGNVLEILDDGSEKEVKEEQNITFVTRDVTLEELSGTWKIEEESIDKWLSGTSLKENRLKYYKKIFNSAYLTVDRNGSASFKDAFYEHKEYKGRGSIFDIKDQLNSKEEGKYLAIRYRKNGSTHWEDFYFIEINNTFYLGEEYYTGDRDVGNEKVHYLLYKKGASR